MDPITIALMAVAALAPVVGDAIGRALSSGDTQRAQQLADEAIRRFNIRAPDIEAMTAHIANTAMSGVRADPASIAAEQSALARLMRYGEQGPQNIEFRAQMDAATRAANQQAASQNALLRNEMLARGRGGSGAEFALRGLATQGAAERAAQGGFQGALAADQRALAALSQGAGLAGRIRGQSFEEGARRAEAADVLARYNEDARVRGAQQQFANQMALAGAQANAAMQGANIYGGRAAGTQEQFRGYGTGLGQAAAAGAGYAMDQQQYKQGQRKKYGPFADEYGG